MVLRARVAFVAFIAGAAPALAQDPPRVTPAEARDRVGSVATVCGVVTSFVCDNAHDTFLNLNGPSTGTGFSIMIAEADRSKFGVAFESGYDRRTVCATGTIGRHASAYVVRVEKANQLHLEGEPAAPSAAAPAFTPCDGGVTVPQPTQQTPARYPPDALQEHIEGVVTLQAVIAADGAVRDARVIESVDPRIDKAALAALNQWRFTPGTRNGTPAAISVVLEMKFAIK